MKCKLPFADASPGKWRLIDEDLVQRVIRFVSKRAADGTTRGAREAWDECEEARVILAELVVEDDAAKPLLVEDGE